MSRRRRIALGLGAALASFVALANALVVHRGQPLVVSAKAATPVNVAVVPGAGLRADGTPSQILEDRLEAARELHARGVVRRILCSGDHGRVGHDEVGAMASWLEARGVPAQDVVLDHAGFDTFNTVTRARRVFGVRAAIFVTQAYHLARVLYLAQAEGIDAQGVAADAHAYPGLAWYRVRELASRSKAVVDVLAGREPRFLGPAVELGP